MKKPQLFLLHFAGGDCYSFGFMKSLLKDFDTIPLELPGRGKRVKEGLVREFDQAARDIYNQLARKLASPTFLIYGHSMGAYLALRVSNMLEKAATPPAYLIVSGNPGPGIKSTREKRMRYLLDRNEFIEELKALGGVPPGLIENQELFDYFEPILRADFEVAERNEMDDEPAVRAPLYAMMGSQEEKVDKIENWGRFTQSRFDYEILEGNHFFIHQHPERIANIIMACSNSIA